MKVVLKCNEEAQHSLRKENQYYAEQLITVLLLWFRVGHHL